MKGVLLGWAKLTVPLALTLSFGGEAIAEMSYSDFSAIKDDAAKFGRFIGAMRACEGLGNSLDGFKEIGSKDLKALAIKDLEDSGMAFEDLEKIDKVITDADNAGYAEFEPQLRVSQSSDRAGFCGSVFIGASMYHTVELMPHESASQIMSSFSNLSVLK